MVDAGDLLFKKFLNPVPENELKKLTEKAHLIVEAFNRMAYDAFGIGDDDLTPGKEFLLEVSKKAHFPFLSSNISDEATEKPLFQPYLIKEVGGLRIGIFSLLSPDFFISPSDPRRKGIMVRSPVDTARNMVKDLQPKTDLIVLLSHLGYPKDMELAQAVPGIHLIVGSHTGLNLVYPHVVKNTIILHTAPKGMYAGKLDLTLANVEAGFYNVATRRSLEASLNSLKSRLSSSQTPEPEKVHLQKSKEDIERNLKQLEDKNGFTNAMLPLTENMKDDPEILKRVDHYLSKYPEAPKPNTPK